MNIEIQKIQDKSSYRHKNNNTSSILTKQLCLLKITWPKKVHPYKKSYSLVMFHFRHTRMLSSCTTPMTSQVKLPIEVDERGDAFRGIRKLRLFGVLEFYLGVPWESPRLGFSHSLFHTPSNLYPKLENSQHKT